MTLEREGKYRFNASELHPHRHFSPLLHRWEHLTNQWHRQEQKAANHVMEAVDNRAGGEPDGCHL